MKAREIRQLYEDFGFNAVDTAKELKSQPMKVGERFGFDESFDGSLTVFYINNLIVILGNGGLSIAKVIE